MKIAIIGLGYVGLPLAIEFGKKYNVIGFDINKNRVEELQKGEDHTGEADTTELREVLNSDFKSLNLLNETSENAVNGSLTFTAEEQDIKDCDIYIVTVPTPIDKHNVPDLQPLIKASEMIGRVISGGNVVIYESTTYPGCTEEDCVPVIEKTSGLKFNKDFFVGYSPERINPGDKEKKLTNIVKVVSGSTPIIADFVENLYSSIITAGTYKASSIKVAEASKIVENVQRDVNISFVNELALIFDRMGIDTNEVIDAASTKWNFVKYTPGLVGGHCISVDPYYLASKAEKLGYLPKVILSGREVNNSIAPFIAHKVLKLMMQKNNTLENANILILGVTFKENCPDIRNTKVVDIYKELIAFGVNVDVCDPFVCEEEIKQEYNIDIIKQIDKNKKYAAVILAVAHQEFLYNFDFESFHKSGTIIFDVKGKVDRRWVDGRL
ncbi:MAG: nucleotide sugar dehydrogenase [Bacteroidales bacterium]|jgi:UDP-N-acetyl-D-galactosamine dehydrogenase|nr:nucleotide sugar dehydrogenase [Bacteroidales bacterium]